MQDNKMLWLFVSPLNDLKLIEEYESNINYNFPDDYKSCIAKYNAAHPKNKVFVSFHGKQKKKRIFNNLFSFNKDDPSTVWKYNDWHGKASDWLEFSDGKVENYIAFAKDPFGNLICFDKTNDHVVFIDHETFAIESVANSFSEFIAGLRAK